MHEKVVYSLTISMAFSLASSDWGVRWGQYLSKKNKLISGEEDVKFLGRGQRVVGGLLQKKTSKRTL
jgi:hypothetical protein